MKFKIHFTVGDFADYFIIEGETIESLKEVAKQETDKRNLEPIKNNIWSEEI